MSETVVPGAPRRVMVVDDDGVSRAAVARALKKRGYAVTAYADPRDALEHLATDKPEAVVTDMRMPHLSGLDVVREVRSRLASAAPPILIVSGEDEEHLLSEAFRLGASDYLLKPVNDTELGVKLERALKAAKDVPAIASQPAIPEHVGEWDLLDCIGRGGTACVFTARRRGDPEGRLHALKLVWPHLVNDTDTLLRFRREIDVLVALSHPRLVRFIESGRHEACFFYVMSYLPGGTLATRIRALGARPAAEALALVAQIAEPLDYLHRHGIVHRDVKPGNIFFDATGGAVLGDFGLARRVHDRGITLGEEFIGTPLYLAPEVFRTSEFDQSVDFYALGVCAYEMLLGEAPLAESDPLQLISRIMAEGLPSVATTIPDLPEGITALLDGLLAPDPAARLQTGTDVLEAVEAARRTLVQEPPAGPGGARRPAAGGPTAG